MLKYISDRAVRIAYCRNHLLETARKNGWLAKAAYYLVLDVDVNANNILTLQNFLTNFEYDLSDWDVMTASQVMGYYDIWALRTKKVVNYDCWKMVGYYRDKLGYCQKSLVERFVLAHKHTIPRDHKLIEVQSAFGGFAVYNTRYLNGCIYSGYEYQDSICEHVPFHECIRRNGGRIFINPKFQNAYSN
ncbi:unnamed protein product [Didymodactylos carnosus]|uniref:Uncharacterized protein n=1 Tax=Didymodactylos carnosus TaxID=1234261 RepID=A0A8S2NAP4_9BILA|nr:unnamed protein product [Didymodactylos carnosus]CAF3993763.1 unnamed protein product [Didymodactylos carnosus]